MTDRNREPDAGDAPATAPDDWSAGWESQEIATLEASLAAIPAQRLEWLEEALEIAWASGALPRE
jgi:hypothetical protein